MKKEDVLQLTCALLASGHYTGIEEGPYYSITHYKDSALCTAVEDAVSIAWNIDKKFEQEDEDK